MKSGIYRIHCTTNKKDYVGQSVNIKQRLRQHRANLRNKHHRNQILQRTFDKYGEGAFEFTVLTHCEILLLDQFEICWIGQLNCATPNGFNLKGGGESLHTCSVETRKKMSIARTGRKASKETKLKMSKALTGRIVTKATRDKLSKSNKGNKASGATKRKLSIAATGKKASEETRLKMSQAHKNPSLMKRRQMSEAAKKRKPMSEETKRKLS